VDGGAKTCVPLNATCRTSGNTCAAHGDCCSKFCNNGVCGSQPSFCTQTGDICSSDAECCGGACNKAAGASIGTCQVVAANGASGCTVSGSVCGAGASGTVVFDGGVPPCGGECCSRACAPYGPTKVLVCQPPSGCRPTGELCRDDKDCCGSNGMPGGNGSVTCSKVGGAAIGRCDNGNACRAAGAICKLATTSCNAENNCCAGNVNQDPTVCQQDILGIPRCTIASGGCPDGGAPRTGQACASSADCCGLNCTPDGTGKLVCGGACVPAAGKCTTNADCCAGLPCAIPPGASQGTCGQPSTTQDAGTAPSDGGNCALYGQSCTVNADCCNGVPCISGRCRVPS
jgi:hypothetical protein